MKVEFNSSDLANQFKGKNIDIYGLYFGNKCVGLTEEKTSCLYGGVTIHDGNQLDEEKVIGVNVFKDGVQQEGFVIKTKKAKVTVQELDTKVRFKLEIYIKYTIKIPVTYKKDAFSFILIIIKINHFIMIYIT